MFRTGEGAGISGVILSRDTVDLFNPKTIRSTMGSVYRVPFLIADDLEAVIGEMKKQGVHLYAAHLKGEQSYDRFDYRESTAFLIGNEGNGLSERTASLADTYVRIPMEGKVESLNAPWHRGSCFTKRRDSGARQNNGKSSRKEESDVPFMGKGI